MPNRHVTAARARLAATLLSALAAAPAGAANLVVTSMGNEHFMCVAHTHKLDGTSLESPAQPVSGTDAAIFDLGKLPGLAQGNSFELDSLALRCWARNANSAGTPPYPGEPSYSIVLHRDDPFWIPDPLIAVGFGPMLPREGWVVNWLLSTDASADPPRHIEILQAWTIPCVNLSNPLPIPYLLTQGPYRLTHDGARVPS